MLAFALAMALAATGAALHADGPGQAAVPNPEPYPLAGGTQSILDLAASALLPGYAFAQSMTLNLTATDSITDGGATALEGAEGITTFESGGSTYAAVAVFQSDGVQILNITDPSAITAVDRITDSLELHGATGIAVFESGGSTYAAVAAYNGDSVQILNIADPSDITAAGRISDTPALELDGASGIAVFESGDSTYAAVASRLDDGVQILNITDPSAITAAGSISDDGTNTDELELNGASGIAVFESGDSTYAAVASRFDDGVQILNITDPSAITAAGSITNIPALVLNGAHGITIFESGDSTYAAVTLHDDNGVQILNITDPFAITAAGNITDADADALVLDRAWGIAVFESGGSTYATVTAHFDDGVQILNITDPSAITAAGSITDTDALVLGGAHGITTFESGDSTYAAVAAYSDDGVQILRLTGAAFAQVPPPDSTPPTFDSSELDSATGVLTITFSEEIDATPATDVVPTKIHIRESGSYTGGTTLAAGELDTTADGTTISFTLTEPHLEAVAGLATPELTIEPGAVRDTSGNPIVGTFDASTATHVDAFPVSSQGLAPQGMAFSSDGAKMFVIDSNEDEVNEYALSTAFDASTAVFVDAFSVLSPESAPHGMAFSNDGAKMFVIDSIEDEVNEYALSTAFDASTATFVDATSVSSEEAIPRGMAFSNDGAKMFVIGTGGDEVNEYALSTAFDASTATHVDAFSVSSEEAIPQGMAFSSDGAKMFVIGSGEGEVNEYALSTAFDASTATHVDAFSVSSQDSIPAGMAFSSDGAKMFVVGLSGRDINEYTLSSVYPITVTGTSTPPAGAFVTVWKTTSADESITIPVGNAVGSYTVDWGDDTAPTTHTSNATHTYAATGNHTVSTSGDFTRIHLDGNSTNAPKLVSIEQWGDIRWTSMARAFYGASSMVLNATDSPDLSRMTNMTEMFRGASSFNGNLSAWDVSSVTDMEHMFRGARAFDGNISGWNVSNVKDMSFMFAYTDVFNQPLNAWDVSGVTEMNDMFRSATSFNQSLGDWDVSSVENMGHMFRNADSFNRPLSDWNTSSVTNMASMFHQTRDFNGDISGWNTSSVTNMNDMFREARSFNQSLNDWDVSSMKNMRQMFGLATSFNQPLNAWDVSSVTDMFQMFLGAFSFDQPLGDWDVSSVTDTSGMFRSATSFNQSLGDWDVSGVTKMNDMFRDASSFDQNLGEWYITLDGTSIDLSTPDAAIGTISAQNPFLDGQSPEYSIGTGDDSDLFVINLADSTLRLDPTDPHSAGTYKVNITSAGGFGVGNSYVLDVTVTGTDTVKPAMASASYLPDTGRLHIAFSEPLGGTVHYDRLHVRDEGMPSGGISLDDADSKSVSGNIITVTLNSTQQATVAGMTRPQLDIGEGAVSDLFDNEIGAAPNQAISLPFVTVWETTNPDESIIISGTGTYAVDWGDGSAPEYVTDIRTHQYDTAGSHTVSIFGGLKSINLGGDSGNAAKLQSIEQWGDIRWTSMTRAFYEASSMIYNATDTPDLSGVTSTINMFAFASSFSGDLSSWNTSLVTDMRAMFRGASSFNSDISGWDVSSVTDMERMFSGARAFDGDISGWNVSNVKDMSFMFAYTDVFNQPLNAWNVSGVTKMNDMFRDASSFDQPLDTWDVSSVTDMAYMFRDASSFDQNLGAWYITLDNASIDLSTPDAVIGTISAQNQFLDGHNPAYGLGGGGDPGLFVVNATSNTLELNPDESHSAGTYTADITATGNFGTDNSHTISVTVTGDADPPTPDAGAFVTVWETTSADESITIPVGGATGTYTIDWGDENISVDVSGDQTHTYDAAGTYTVSISGDFTRIALLELVPDNALKLQSIEQWGDIRWTTMAHAFQGARNMVYNATDSPDLSGVADMSDMFYSNHRFNGNLSSWDVSGVTNMGSMFAFAFDFSRDISDWNTGNVADMNGMFQSASSFDQPLGDWNVSGVTNMNGMFNGARAFNGNLSGWNVSNVKDMSFMFAYTDVFNQPLNAWDVSSVTNMNNMFASASDFNQPLNAWDVSGVTNMNGMFQSASSFNRPLGDWDVSGVTRMVAMFLSAVSFNQPLDDWDVSSVTDMGSMFTLANSFNRPLGGWYVVPNSTEIERSAIPGVVGSISAQNTFLDGQGPTYRVSGPDSDHFEISGGNLLNMTSDDVGQDEYTITVVASNPNLFGSNNRQAVVITVTGQADTAPPAFITIWKTTAAGQPITIPVGGAVGSYTVDWGDDTAPTTHTSDATHTYAAAGSHTVSISGDFTRIHLDGNSTNAPKLVSIEQWGDIRWTSMERAFYGASSMTYNATDTPDLSGVTSMAYMFRGASDFDGDLSSWDVSSVTNMTNMFASASHFNQPLNAWDVSSVTDMSDMFRSADFNQPLNAWDVSSVTDMSDMFRIAYSFDQPLGDWNVSSVTDMSDMFRNAFDFNQPLGDWNVSSVTDMSDMFSSAYDFNQPLNAWDVSSVTDMSYMFRSASDFNQPLNAWDVSSVTDMDAMFNDATSFDRPLGDWDVSSVTSMNSMFSTATSFDQPLGDWDVSSVTEMTGMFLFAASFNQPLGDWDVSSVTEMASMFLSANSFSQNLGNWYIVLDNTSIDLESGAAIGNITAQNGFLNGQNPAYGIGPGGNSGLFVISATGNTLELNPDGSHSAGTYTANITATGDFGTDNSRTISVTVTGDADPPTPDAGAFVTVWETTSADESITIPVGGAVGSYTVDWGDGTAPATHTSDATHTYAAAGNHTVSISGDFTRIHLDGNSTNAPKLVSIEQWGDIRWTSMERAFYGASSMTYNATDTPDLSGVISMAYMFRGASSFNGDLSSWNVSSVTDMAYMFRGAPSFDQPLGDWDVSSVTDMAYMFRGAPSFDQPLNAWDVSSVTNMNNMFNGASSFDQPLNAWNVSSVTDMNAMFYGASSFDQPLNAWNVSSVTDMNAMFNDATSFNQPLGDWDVSSVTDMNNMFLFANSFNQNLGNWYIVLDNTSIDLSTPDAVIGTISAQNSVLDGHNPAYGLGGGDDSGLFVVNGAQLGLNPGESHSAGTYTADITATGDFGTDNSRTISVTVTGTPTVTGPPTAHAGADQEAGAGDTVILDGSGSSDPGDDPLIFLWNQTSGPAVMLSDAAAESPMFDAPAVTGDTDLVFILNVTAGGESDTDTVTVTVLDTIPPAFESADYNTGDGMLVIAFSEPISQTANTTGLHVREEGSGSGGATLTGAGYTVDGDTLTVTLNQAQRDTVAGLTSHELDIDEGAVSDLENNRIAASVDNKLTVMDTIPPAFESADYATGNGTLVIAFSEPISQTANTTGLHVREEGSGSGGATLTGAGYTVDGDTLTVTLNQAQRDTVAGLTSHELDIDEGAVSDLENNRIAASVDNKLTVMDTIPPAFESADYATGNGTLVIAFSEPISQTANTTGLHVREEGTGSGGATLTGAGYTVDGDTLTVTLNQAQRDTVAGLTSHELDIDEGAVSDLENNRIAASVDNKLTVTDTVTDELPEGAFITVWETTSPNRPITIPVGGAVGSYTVDWGDGTAPTTHTSDATHTYAAAGNHTVSISGDFTRIYLNGRDVYGAKLVSIEQWGNIQWKSMGGAFYGAPSMTYNATDTPDLSGVTGMAHMFRGASSFDGDISTWNVSSVTNMAYMFDGASSFDQPLGDWDVSSVTDMSNMFDTATSFNQPLNAWNVSGVTDMSNMFDTATSFNQPLNAWNVSGVTDMSNMFGTATSFNQPLGDWDVSSSTDMSSMFVFADSFNQPLGDWDVSSVTSMNGMFYAASSFDQPLGDWDVSSVTDMNDMFLFAGSFNQNLGNWYIVLDSASIDLESGAAIGNITAQNGFLNGQNPAYGIGPGDDSGLFVVNATGSTLELNPGESHSAGFYTVNITATGNFGTDNSRTISVTVTGDADPPTPDAGAFVTVWETTSADESITIPVGNAGGSYTVDWGDDTAPTTHTSDAAHTYAATGNHTVSISGDFTRIHLDGNSTNAPKLVSIEQWGDIRWTSMVHAFYGASSMTYNATDTPDLSGVGSMRGMFRGAFSFDGDISSWNVSSVTDMDSMFFDASSFDRPLNAWNVSSVTDMNSMFRDTVFFNQPLNAWNVSSVTNMAYMFDGATDFSQPLNAWNVSSVTDMSYMFGVTDSFNSDISGWDVSSVTDMRSMFDGASSFDQPLGDWDISGVTDMSNMFNGATSFNQPLGAWNVSSVTDMDYMFYSASDFNQPLNAWDVSSVTDMFDMFDGATSFNQNLGNWYIVLDSASIDLESGAAIGNITAQNGFLNGQNPAYGIGPGDDSGLFVVNATGNTLELNPGESHSAGFYTANITATGNFGTDNSRTISVTVTGDAPSTLDAGAFVTVWETTSADESITIPVGGAVGSYTVDWGDDTAPTTHTSDATHTYAAAGNHTVSISGDFTRIHLDGNSTNAPKLVSIEQWGDIEWDTMENAFYGASDMVYNADDTPDLSGMTSMNGMFRGARSFSGDLSSWNTLLVTDMERLFNGARAFNGDISGWNVSNVKDMSTMFAYTDVFNQPLNAWDVSGVTEMNEMFRDARSFNQSLGDWDTSSVENMYRMFRQADSFDQSISRWDTSKVTDMRDMFTKATAFDRPLNAWDVSGVTDMYQMFYEASSFNQPLGDWDVSSVENMGAMFRDADSFNRPLSDWNTSSVTDMAYMFYLNNNFNGDISGWNTSSVTDMEAMFTEARKFNGDISGWNTSSVTDMESMFWSAVAFNRPLNAWDVSGVTNMYQMFYEASSFNGTLNAWNTSSVTDMYNMFWGANSFNRPLGDWNVSSVENMSAMFRGASSFDQPLGAWDVSSVTGMGSMFDGASSFDRPLGDWNVSSVTNMLNMFRGASSFDQPLNAWDVSSVTRMDAMFFGASSFDQLLGDWDVSSVTDMTGMFLFASSFDQNLGAWYVTLDGTSIDLSTPDAVIGTISAQNPFLDGHNPAYGIGPGGDSGLFVVNATGNTLELNPDGSHSAGTYTANITSTGSFGTNNHRMVSVTVTGDAPSTLDAGAFVTVWETTSADESITIPVGGAVGSYTVNWGDDTAPTTHTSDATHTYAATGNHTVSISGDFTRIHLDGNSTNAPKLVSIEQWGDIRWTSMARAFYGASSMTYNATDTPDLSGVGSMSNMFRGASSFDGDISSWNVSSVTDMSYMFSGASSFAQPLGDWDVSSVTGMRSMFDGASSFDQTLNAWNVSSVTDMSYMFSGASSFDRPLNAWDVSSVTDMSYMFIFASSFNQPLGDWDVSGVTDMSSMFAFANSFNQPLGDWDVSGVTDMSSMFLSATFFNQPLGEWDVSGVAHMGSMFLGATSFDQPLGGWYVVPNSTEIERSAIPGVVGSISAQNSFLGGQNPTYSITSGSDSDHFEISGGNLLNMTSADSDQDEYTITVVASGSALFGSNNRQTVVITVTGQADTSPPAFITTWETTAADESITIPGTGTYTVNWGDGQPSGNVTGSVEYEYASPGNHTVHISGGLTAITLGDNATNAAKLRSIDQWGGIAWTSMRDAFRGATGMTYDAADAPDLSGVTDMSGMFRSAGSFNGNLSTWDVSGVTTMSYMFDGATSFNSTISGWDVSEVTDMDSMFNGATSFNSTISGWDVSEVTDMYSMFNGATSFNSDISGWDVSEVADMYSMFNGATSFNSDISGWDVSEVADMDSMFNGATSFNSDISGWSVSKVGNMYSMFGGATSFNSDISGWDVSEVTDMEYMFGGATSFNSDISGWSVSKVKSMYFMFNGATSFNSDISGWDVSEVADMESMFDGATSFNQNLGNWYIVLDSASIDLESGAAIGNITAQNGFLNGQNPAYGIGPGDDSGLFVVNAIGNTLELNPGEDHSAGTYTANITATGDFGTDNSRTISVTVTGAASGPPTADAGANQTVDGGVTVTLNGTGSSDPDSDPLEFSWSQTGTPAVQLAGDDTATPSFTAPTVTEQTDLVFTLTVTAAGESGTDTVTITVTGTAPPAFITTWETTTTHGVIGIPGTGTYTVNWGDGQPSGNATDFTSHVYASPGNYTVHISGGLTAITLGDGTTANAAKLRSIDQWGGIAWTSMEDAFSGAANVRYNATDTPDLSGVGSMSSMFRGASSFDGDISSWNVSSVTDMDYMFYNASSFDGDISSWNVSSVTDMDYMFYNASSFDQTLNAWDVSSVTGMTYMFYGTTSFDGDISEWDVSSVTDMQFMFYDASSFDGDISEWDVSSVTDMQLMFTEASSFDGDISEWDVSSVTDMLGMFWRASSFNQTLNAWDVSSVTDMSSMFDGATSFDGDISEWDVSSVTDMNTMFADATSFDQSLNAWNVSSVTDMLGMFWGAASFNQTLNAGTSRQSPTCNSCSTAPPPLTGTSPSGTSRQSPTCSACSGTPPPSTRPSTPGTSRQSPTCATCSPAPHPLIRTSETGTSCLTAPP